MALIGSIEHFNAEKQDFRDYSERMEQFFIVNQVKEAMKVPMLITLIGPETYNILKNLVSPDSPATKTYVELIESLTKHYVVKKSAVAGRYEFYKCNQKEQQSVNDYVVEIKRKAAPCKFGTFLNEALRDRLVCGLSREQLIKKLLTVGDSLSFEEAVKIATAYETAESETKNIQPDVNVQTLRKQLSVQKRYPFQTLGRSKIGDVQGARGNTSYERNNGECTRCGGKHMSDKCFKKNWVCFHCNRPGHIATKCHFRLSGERNMLKQMDEQRTEKQDIEEGEVILGSIQQLAGEEDIAWMPL